jgi:peptidyl-prolyl cis-trans isomerase SurA
MIDPNGFTIVSVEKKILATPPSLAQVKEQVDAQVRSKRSHERYKQWIERLRKKAIIKKYI